MQAKSDGGDLPDARTGSMARGNWSRTADGISGSAVDSFNGTMGLGVARAGVNLTGGEPWPSGSSKASWRSRFAMSSDWIGREVVVGIVVTISIGCGRVVSRIGSNSGMEEGAAVGRWVGGSVGASVASVVVVEVEERRGGMNAGRANGRSRLTKGRRGSESSVGASSKSSGSGVDVRDGRPKGLRVVRSLGRRKGRKGRRVVEPSADGRNCLRGGRTGGRRSAGRMSGRRVVVLVTVSSVVSGWTSSLAPSAGIERQS